MKRITILSTLRYIVLSCSLFGLAFNSSPPEAIAKEPKSDATSIGLNRYTADSDGNSKVKKPQLRDRGMPTGRRRGGTSRSECQATNETLTAIVPGKETKAREVTLNYHHLLETKSFTQNSFTNSQSFLSRTLEEYPSFWLYVPELAGSSQQGEFILQDDEANDIYRANFNLPERAGIINLNLPNRADYALKIGQKYHWYVKIFCDAPDKEQDYIFVDAWIERIAVSPSLKRLNEPDANPYQILIDNNIWYDAIDRLAEMQQTSEYKKTRWQQLLTALGLSDLIEKKVIDVRANFPVK